VNFGKSREMHRAAPVKHTGRKKRAALRAGRAEGGNSPREPIAQDAQGKHAGVSHIVSSFSTVLCSTGTIFQRKSKGSSQE
jgi:hypothetical protein